MPWFKVDDTLAFHAKVVVAGNAAMGLWVRAGAWSAQQLTDGFVPDHMVLMLGNRGQAKALVGAGLWVQGEGGYWFHQWAENGRQPTREEVETKREEWRNKKRQQRRGTSGEYVSPGDSQRDSPEDKSETPSGSPTVRDARALSRPVPTRPMSVVQPVVEDEEPSSSSSPTYRASRR